jgi:hypothetical protein
MKERSRERSRERKPNNNSFKLHVSHLPLNLTENDVKNEFER